MVKVILTAPKSFVKGNFEAFRSSVDGSVLRTQRDVQEHNKRNNVVCLGDGYDDATVRSGSFNKGASATMTKQDRVEDIKEAIQKLEQGYKPTLENAGADDGP
jgi:DNA-binding NarL/FixJ family response regulator